MSGGTRPGAGDRPTLYLVDGHAQFFRAYHAIRGGMSSPVTGEPTHLVFGFLGMLLKVLREERPDYLAVAIDASGDRGTFRSAIYPEYKAHREAPPEDFRPQVERVLQLLGRMDVPVIGIEGVEADDTIATIVRRVRAEHPDVRIRILSRDKDLTQLVGDDVELFDAMKDAVVTPSDLFKTEGVEARHVIDILALMGDKADNVPGVPGIGEKTAAKLVLQYGSADALFAHLDEIKGKRRESLEACRDQIPLAKRLVALKDDVELDFDLERARFDPAQMDVSGLLEDFRTLNFNTHAAQLRELVGGGGEAGSSSVARSAADADHADAAGTLFAALAGGGGGDGGAAPIREPNGDYRAITTLGDLEAFAQALRAAGRFCVDVETDALAPTRAGLVGVALALREGEGVYVPVRSPEPAAHLDAAAVREVLGPLLADEALVKVGHNLKYDLVVLHRAGMPVAGPLEDTMVADYLLEPARSSRKMDSLAEAELGIRCIPITELIGDGGGRGRAKQPQKAFDEVPLDRATPYAAEDADVTLRLADRFAARLAERGLETLFRTVEMPLVPILAAMERTGIRVEADELDRQREALEERIVELRGEIERAAPHPFDPGSPKQLAAVLFNDPGDAELPGLGLPVQKKGKTGPSTDVEVLEKLALLPECVTPIPELVLELRQLVKLVSTYLVALKEAIHPDTGRVHASFNQTVAETGRLSSSDPNLQNIPVRTEVGRRIRRAFVADPGFELVAADYSQIELRVLAHLSEDPALVEAFHAGADIHRSVAAQTFGVDPAEVTPEQRNVAKMINFGIVYGITPFGLARRLGGAITQGEAKTVIEEYRERHAGIDRFLEACVAEAKETGAVTTILGRRRPIPEIESRNPAQRSLGERRAINTVVQGSAADLIKKAMVDLAAVLPDRFPAARLLLQVHDELVLEAPAEEAADLASFVAGVMERAMDLRVPLAVETAHAFRWSDAK